MPGQPNRRPRSEVPVKGLEPARPVGHGIPGGHEIDAAWADTDDVLVLKDRLRRRKLQVEKLKEQKALAVAAQALKFEEGYTDALVNLAPQLLAVDQKVTEIVTQLLSGDLDEEQVKLLKALLPELTKQRDRLYGKTRQRLSTTSVSASVDINELMSRGRSAESVPAVDAVDVEVLGEEIGDE